MNINFKYWLFFSILFFSILYCLLYILRDFYFATQNFRMKRYINKILPFFTRYNKLFLILTLMFLIFSFYNMYISKIYFTLIIIPIVLSFTFIYIPMIKFQYSKYLKVLSYILLIDSVLFLFSQSIVL